MIPILMALFAAGGTIYGMAEESLPFYACWVPVMLAARFDPVVAASTVLLGAGSARLAPTINPFAVVIAANAAGIPFTNGIVPLRVALLVIGWIICVAWVMRYAPKVRRIPSLSIVADKQEENRAHFLGDKGEQSAGIPRVRKIIPVIFALAFLVMIYSVAVLGWWMAEISAVFLASAIIVGLIARMSEEGAGDVDVYQRRARFAGRRADYRHRARGIVVIMDKGMIAQHHFAQRGRGGRRVVHGSVYQRDVLAGGGSSCCRFLCLLHPAGRSDDADHGARLPISLTSAATRW